MIYETKRYQRQTPCHPTIRRPIRQNYLRYHAPGQLRRRAAIRPRTHLDLVPAHPRRTGNPRSPGSRSVGHPLLPFPGSALSLARLGRAPGNPARRPDQPTRRPRRRPPKHLLRLRQHRPPPASARPQNPARCYPAPESHQRNHDRRRARPHRHRAQLPRRPGQSPRTHHRSHKPHPRLHPLPGLRRAAPQNGRKRQRRRPILHPAPDHQSHGAGHRSPGR